MMMSNRAKGRKLELMEAKAWHNAGWTVEARHPAKFVGPGKTALCDYFDRYDLIAASPEQKTVVLIQVSTESPNSHEEPLGMMIAPENGPVFHPDALLNSLIGVPCLPGIYEVYSMYRRLKGSRKWIAVRRWYV